jgi:hypothetical protein
LLARMNFFMIERESHIADIGVPGYKQKWGNTHCEIIFPEQK